MIDIEKWGEIFGTLRRHKLRTALTAFGVFWGIFMLTVLLGAGKGLENGVNEGFPRVTNTVYIWQQGATQIPYEGMPIGRQIQLKPEDVDAIAKNVSSVGFVTGQNSVGIWGGGNAPYVVRKSRNGGSASRAPSQASRTSTRCASSRDGLLKSSATCATCRATRPQSTTIRRCGRSGSIALPARRRDDSIRRRERFSMRMPRE